jgi:hypothetical protein
MDKLEDFIGTELDFARETKSDKVHLKFSSVSFSEFQDGFKIDPFFYDLAGDLLTPYRVLYEHGPWIGGGFLTRAIQGETFENFGGDIDVWFSSMEQRDSFAQDLHDERFGLKAVPAERYKSDYSYSYILSYKGREFKLQLISYKTFSSVDHLLRRFDVFSAMFGTDGVNVFYESDTALKSAIKKQLMFNWGHLNATTAHPDARYVLKRYTKFIKSGYKITDSEINRFTALLRKIPMPEREKSQDGYGHF